MKVSYVPGDEEICLHDSYSSLSVYLNLPGPLHLYNLRASCLPRADCKFQAKSQSRIMAHPYYSRHEPYEDPGRQQRTNAPFPTHQCPDNEEQHDHLVRSSSSAQSSDFDSKIRPAHRRRIQVACGRCRKRKIKCSGDTGNGQGCTNCQSSGSTNCQFLRVNSSEVKPAYQDFQYSTSVVPVSGPPTSPYGNRCFQRPSTLMHSSTLHTSPYSRSHSTTDLGSLAQSVTVTRNPYTALHYDDVLCGVQHSPAYMLPSTSSMVVPNYGGSPGSPRSWNPTGGLSRTQSTVFYPDQDSGSSLGTSSYSYTNPNPNSADAPSVFPVTTSLSMTEGSDRTLPTPTSRQQYNPTGTSSRDSEMAIPGLPFSSEQAPLRLSTHYDLKTTSTTGTGIATETATCSLGPVITARTAPSTAHDAILSYMPGPPNSSPESITSSTAFTGTETVDSVDSTDTSLVSRTGSGLLTPDSRSCEMYGYSSSSRNGNRPDPVVMSGHTYTRLRPSNSFTPPFNLLRSNTTDFSSSASPQQTPVTSLNDPNCY